MRYPILNLNMISNKRGPNAQGKKKSNKQGEKKRKSISGPSRIPGRSVSVAAAYQRQQVSLPPKIFSKGGSTRIIHRELIGTISGSDDFAVALSLPLNPGMASTFPWLSGRAIGFERYRFNVLKFEFFTITGSTTPGEVLLSPDYDAADAAPADERSASENVDTETCAAWSETKCCALKANALHAMGPSKFVRGGPLAANLDVKTYDSGNMFVCVQNGSNVKWGKIWVEYDVELMTPSHVLASSLAAASVWNKAVPTDADLIAESVPDPANNSGVSYASNVLTFSSPGDYLVLLEVAGNLPAENAPTVSGGSTLLLNSAVTQATAAMSRMFQVRMIAGGTLTLNDTIGVGTAGCLVVSLLPVALGTISLS